MPTWNYATVHDNGNIRFIDYYAAPSPKPAAPSPKPAGTSADTGEAWQGPGGTPGLNQSGDALIMGARHQRALLGPRVGISFPYGLPLTRCDIRAGGMASTSRTRIQ